MFNVGSTEEISILDLANRVIALTASSSEIAFIPYERAYGEGFEDLQRRVPDITRIRQLVGWAPEYSLDQTILDVVEWLRGERGSGAE